MLTAQERKSIREALSGITTGIHPDKIVTHKDGSMSIYRSYFYTFGNTAHIWTMRVASVLSSLGVEVEAVGIDEYAQWPKTSYFRCHITAIKNVKKE